MPHSRGISLPVLLAALIALSLGAGLATLEQLSAPAAASHATAPVGGGVSTPLRTGRESVANVASGCSRTSAGIVPTGEEGLLSPLAPATVASGEHPYAVAVSPDGRDVYVADYGSESVSQFSRDPATGRLTALSPAAVAAAIEPHSVAVSADDRNVYVANTGSDSVSQYARNPATGTLGALSPATVAAGAIPRSIAVSPDGRNVYVANTGDTEGSEEAVSQYRRDPRTGELSALSPGTVQAGFNPRFVTVSRDGKSVYVAAYGAGAIVGFTRNPSSGALEGRTAYPVSARPLSIAVSPDLHSVYVADYDTGGISQFARNPTTGRLAALAPPTVAAGEETHSVVVSPDGANVYATNATPSGTLSQYSRDLKTGALTAVGPAAIEVGSEPTAIALSPEGSSAYITNHRSSSISQYERATATEAGAAPMLTSMSARGGRVSLQGLVGPSLVGLRVTIVLDGKTRVATATVAPGGHFAATAPLPRGSAGHDGGGPRYAVEVGRLRSAEVALDRRLILDPPRISPGEVTLRGRVVPPPTEPSSPVIVRRRVGCGRDVTIAAIKPSTGGGYEITLRDPAGAETAIYQTTTLVRASTGRRAQFKTFSLEEPVRLR